MGKKIELMNNSIVFGKNVRLGQHTVLTGDLAIGDDVSIWHNAVVRADVAPIVIGNQTNIQDNTVIHGQLGKWSVTIGERVTVGHSCILHGCHLASDCFIGMGSIIMNGAYIGSNVLVAAGSLIPGGARFDEPNVLVMGRPGKIVRSLTEEEINLLKETPSNYIQYAENCLSLMKG